MQILMARYRIDGLILSKTKLSYEKKVEVLENIDMIETKKLVVFNDDVNTFVHVIETLIRVCEHTPQQAEQCAWIIHHRGECVVKEGSLDILQPMCEAICKEGIEARLL